MALWGIPDEFGGMTATSLYRASMFLDGAGADAAIVTFEPKPGYAAQLEVLRRQGKISGNVQVLNPFLHYRTADLDRRPPVTSNDSHDLGSLVGGVESIDDDGRLFSRTSMRSGTDTVALNEYFRADGTVYLRDEFPLAATGGGPKRSMSLLSTDGTVVGNWTAAGAFYRSWLVELSAGNSSAIIVDSAFASKVIGPLREPHIVKLMVLHNPHVAGGGDPLRGKLAQGQQSIHADINQWDGIVFLTDEQRLDYEKRFGTLPTLHTVSNPKKRLDRIPPFVHRVLTRGVLLGRLAPQKNLTHAIRVMEKVIQKVPEATLEIYGRGPQEQELRSLIAELGLNDTVYLKGHDPYAADEFNTAGFSLLTSRNEGQGLTLMESQGHGCPPVSYDIRYGPSSVIEDGVNGFLVAPGDIEGAASKIVQLCTDPATAERISSNAWQSAVQYGDEAVLAQWATALADTWSRRESRTQVKGVQMSVESLALGSDGNVDLSLFFSWRQLSGPPLSNNLRVEVLAQPRTDGDLVVLPAPCESRGSYGVVASVRLDPNLIGQGASSSEDFVDISCRIVGSDVAKTFRVGYPNAESRLVAFESVNGDASVRSTS